MGRSRGGPGRLRRPVPKPALDGSYREHVPTTHGGRRASRAAQVQIEFSQEVHTHKKRVLVYTSGVGARLRRARGAARRNSARVFLLASLAKKAALRLRRSPHTVFYHGMVAALRAASPCINILKEKKNLKKNFKKKFKFFSNKKF